MFFFIIIIFITPSLFVAANFISYLISGSTITNIKLWRILQICVIVILPLVYLWEQDLSATHECCSEGTIFSPKHRIGMYFLIVSSMVAYLISIYRKNIWPPIGELLLNVWLVLGLVITGFVFFQIGEDRADSYFGVLPVTMLYLIALADNHRKIKNQVDLNNYYPIAGLGHFFRSVLMANIFVKFPALAILVGPLLIFISLGFLLFGQKPDSIIKAFTETYHHGFSQLDYLCANVDCGGHFLCSVGANGHPAIVRPVRFGVRNGGRIICNRQLLVSNAFEELIQEKFPKAHRKIRQLYNKVGEMVHRHYHVFNKKEVSDVTYFIMKPLEWMFLLVLYTFDKKPENRIAVQYLDWEERAKIKEAIFQGEADLTNRVSI